MFRSALNPKSRWGPNPAFPLCGFLLEAAGRESLKNAALRIYNKDFTHLYIMQGLFLFHSFLSWGRGGKSSCCLSGFTEQSWLAPCPQLGGQRPSKQGEQIHYRVGRETTDFKR